MVNEDIKNLIPQRDPIMMVDKLIDVDGDVAVTSLTVRDDNYFMDEDGLLAEPFAGYRAMASGAVIPPVGYIGEVKKFHCYRRPHVDDELRTVITMGTEIAGVTVITGEIRLRDEIIADTQMKIFIEKNG